MVKRIKKDLNGKNKQVHVQISQEELRKILKKIPNWKAPGSDGVRVKNFNSLHKKPCMAPKCLPGKRNICG